jgi:tetratricopeptide (TPR) repeat protein
MIGTLSHCSPKLCSFLLAFVVVIAAHDLSAEDWKVGDRVVVAKNAPLRVNSETVDTVPAGTVLKIRNLNRKWLWVTHRSSGWLDQAFVVSAAARVAELNVAATASFTKKDFDEARRLFQQVLDIDPKNRQALLLFAVSYYTQGNYHDAIAGFDIAIDADPNLSLAYYWRGESWFGLGEYEKAIDDYNRAIDLNVGGVAFKDRAKARAKLGDMRNAIVDLTVATHLGERAWYIPAAYGLRGEAWIQEGDEAAAAADFAMAGRFQPQDGQYWIKAARILATSRSESVRNGRLAVRYAQRACETTQDPPAEFLAVLAAAYAEDGEFPFAVATQEKAIERAEPGIRKDYIDRMKLYQSGQAYRVTGAEDLLESPVRAKRDPP